MAVSLLNFRQITGGFARACHFNLGILDFKNLAVPNIKSDSLGAKMLVSMGMFASSTSLPSRIIETHKIPVQYGQPNITVAKNVNYSTWKVTFYADEALCLRNLFLRWQEVIYNTPTHSYTLPSRYKSQQAFVAVLSGSNKEVMTYSFKGLFPTEVGEISLNQQDSGVITFDITFDFDYFEVNTKEAFELSSVVPLVYKTKNEEEKDITQAYSKIN